jgi:hypothetical protein
MIAQAELERARVRAEPGVLQRALEVAGVALQDVERRAALGGEHRLDAAVGADVDLDVDAPELARRLLDHPGSLGDLGQVCGAVGHAHAVGLGNFLSQFFNRRSLAEAVQHEVGASGGEHARNSESDPARRTGNNSHLAFQHDDLPCKKGFRAGLAQPIRLSNAG